MTPRDRFNMLVQIESTIKSMESSVLAADQAHYKLILDMKNAHQLLKELRDSLIREQEEKDNG